MWLQNNQIQTFTKPSAVVNISNVHHYIISWISDPPSTQLNKHHTNTTAKYFRFEVGNDTAVYSAPRQCQVHNDSERSAANHWPTSEEERRGLRRCGLMGNWLWGQDRSPTPLCLTDQNSDGKQTAEETKVTMTRRRGKWNCSSILCCVTE